MSSWKEIQKIAVTSYLRRKTGLENNFFLLFVYICVINAYNRSKQKGQPRLKEMS